MGAGGALVILRVLLGEQALVQLAVFDLGLPVTMADLPLSLYRR